MNTPEMYLLVAAILAAALSACVLVRIFRREAVQQTRLNSYRGSVAFKQRSGTPPWYRRFGSVVAISPIVGSVEQQRLLKLLVLAGIKGRNSLANFIAIKVFSGAVLAGLVWLFVDWRMLFEVAAIGGALLGGWRIPDIVLNRLIKQRQLRLEKGMPDAMDLLVVCSEAGLSLNQAIDEVSRQLVTSNKDVADEFAATSAELRIVPDFSRALDNLVERTGLADLRSLVATLKQSLKFGTSLAESLRMIAAEMRATRQARMEERASRLPVLLAIPMMMFILPCLMMIVGTPIALHMMDALKNVLGGLSGLGR